MAKQNKELTFYLVKSCKQKHFVFPLLSVCKHSTTNQYRPMVRGSLSSFNLCSSSWWQESSNVRKRERFLPGACCSCPTLFPKTNSQGLWGFNFTSSRVRTQTFSALYSSVPAPPIMLLKTVFFSCLLHTSNFQGLCRNAVASGFLA